MDNEETATAAPVKKTKKGAGASTASLVVFLPLAAQFTDDGRPVMPGREPPEWAEESVG